MERRAVSSLLAIGIVAIIVVAGALVYALSMLSYTNPMDTSSSSTTTSSTSSTSHTSSSTSTSFSLKSTTSTQASVLSIAGGLSVTGMAGSGALTISVTNNGQIPVVRIEVSPSSGGLSPNTDVVFDWNGRALAANNSLTQSITATGTEAVHSGTTILSAGTSYTFTVTITFQDATVQVQHVDLVAQM